MYARLEDVYDYLWNRNDPQQMLLWYGSSPVTRFSIQLVSRCIRMQKLPRFSLFPEITFSEKLICFLCQKCIRCTTNFSLYFVHYAVHYKVNLFTLLIFQSFGRQVYFKNFSLRTCFSQVHFSENDSKFPFTHFRLRKNCSH